MSAELAAVGIKHTNLQWRLVVKMPGKAAKFHLWLNIL